MRKYTLANYRLLEYISYMANEVKNDFDWAEAARTVGASEKQVEFAKALLSGANNTSAARSAGYAGDDVQLRSAGYAAARSGKVQALLSLARAGGAGVVDDIVSLDESKRILSRLARQGDPNAKVRALSALQQLRAGEAADDYPDWSPDVTARRLCEAAGEGGALAAASIYYKQWKTLCGLPLGKQIVPLVRREFPEAFAQFVASLPPGNKHHEEEILKLASGPITAIGKFVPDGAERPADSGAEASHGGSTEAKANGSTTAAADSVEPKATAGDVHEDSGKTWNPATFQWE